MVLFVTRVVSCHLILSAISIVLRAPVEGVTPSYIVLAGLGSVTGREYIIYGSSCLYHCVVES